ncbi:hypothetical protein BDV39DRAFT_199334 [Aspergillus sergii]|uniref:F-box domain-containing protein n=1 Tax=Aspergillus sergii TaxID=1034303 RepID=A0A5N6XIA8_9EURO|nr:hypothetical protein BDV39DRAFT_199334 [Aspergillus sergii]
MRSSLTQNLSLLPNEVLSILILALDRPAQLDLARVDKHLRSLCLPVIFKSISITFSTSSFKRLEHLATSHLSEYVKILEYKTTGLLLPCVSDPDIFESEIYTPEDFRDDQRDGIWVSDIDYQDVQPTMGDIAKDQNMVLDNGTDFSTLVVFLFKNLYLKKFVFQYTCPLDSLQDWYPIRERESGLRSIEQSFERHFTASFHAMRLKGMISPIRSLEIFNVWQDIGKRYYELFQEVLRRVRELHLHDAHVFKTIAKHIDTPSLRTFKLDSVEIQLDLLEVFCKKNHQNLGTLHLRTTYFQRQIKGQEDGGKDAPPSLLQDFYKIGKSECVCTS